MSPSRPRPNSASYLARDTIAAITTGVGGSVAIVRVSGPDARAALSRLSGGKPGELEPRRLSRLRLRSESGAELDDALAVLFVAPASFTGEDVLELQLHGGGFIAQRVLEELAAAGVRQALPGEFSFRAVRNGKLSLSQARAVADLIAAANDGAVSLALEKLGGLENRFVSELAATLRHLAMMGEVGIDFSDQDIEEVGLPALKRQLEKVRETLARLRESYQRGSRLQDGVGIAFVGLPNAGKSSFFNALLGEDRSIVSEVAGTTRDLVRERLTLGARGRTVTLRLEDTAGLRPTEDKVERLGIERTRRAAQAADLVLFVVDPTAPFGEARTQWRELGAKGARALGILTKTDLATPAQVSACREQGNTLGIAEWVETSAVTGQGIHAAAERITEHCLRWTERSPGEVLLTRLDQAESVDGALEHLARAAQAPELDLFAADLRQALAALSPLIGETLPDDILGQIFANFCIGK